VSQCCAASPHSGPSICEVPTAWVAPQQSAAAGKGASPHRVRAHHRMPQPAPFCAGAHCRDLQAGPGAVIAQISRALSCHGVPAPVAVVHVKVIFNSFLLECGFSPAPLSLMPAHGSSTRTGLQVYTGNISWGGLVPEESAWRAARVNTALGPSQ